MEQSSFMFQVMFPRPEYEKSESEVGEDWLEDEKKEKERKISDTKETRTPTSLTLTPHNFCVTRTWC